jgi:hypothetical protein
MGGASRSLSEFGNASNKASVAAEGHKLSLGRVERALASYVGHAAGANAVTESLSVAFGSFALGGGVIAGALIGIGAIVAAYEKLTEATRAATKAQDDAIASASKALLMKGAGVGGQDVLNLGQMSARMLALQAKRAQVETAIATPAKAGDIGNFIALALNKNKLADLNEQIADLADVMKGTRKSIDDSIKAKDIETLGAEARKEAEAHAKVAAALEKAQADLIRYNEMMKQAYGGFLGITPAVRGPLSSRRAGLDSPLTPEQSAAIGSQVMGGLGGPDQFATESAVHEAVQAFKDGTGAQLAQAERNTQTIANAVVQGASVIVNALNIGGGGRGSGIGGALGSVAGNAVGTLVGASMGKLGATFGSLIAPGVGTIIGGLAGSLLGGLFDHHKKAIDNNTNAVRANTAAMLQFAPSGFRVESYRYSSTSVKDTMQDFARYKTRGGVVSLGT